MPEIRYATPADLPRLVEIYNQAIAAGDATADTIAQTVAGRRDWFDQHDIERHPIYVCEEAGGWVSGYLSLSSYRNRPALERTRELSYYVDYARHGRGIGTALMEHALQDLPHTGAQVLLAIVLEWNLASIHLLEKFSFERWGYLPEVADFSGRLCGHLYYGRRFGPSPA